MQWNGEQIPWRQSEETCKSLSLSLYNLGFIKLTLFTIYSLNSDSDRVDDLMDEMQDEKDVHDQISDAISRGHGTDLNDVSFTTQ